MGKRHKTTVATIFMKASVETEAFKVNGGVYETHFATG